MELSEVETILVAALMHAGMPSEQAEMFARKAPESVKEEAKGQSKEGLSEKAFWLTTSKEETTKILKAVEGAMRDERLTEVFVKLLGTVSTRMQDLAGLKVPHSVTAYAIAEKMLDIGYAASREACVPHLSAAMAAGLTPFEHWKEALRLAEEIKSDGS